MKKTILDTSTILDISKINFKSIAGYKKYKEEGKNNKIKELAGVGVEALILYDTILFDEFSINNILDGKIINRAHTSDEKRNIEKMVSRIDKLTALFSPIEESKSSVAEIYSEIIELFDDFLKSDFDQLNYQELYNYYFSNDSFTGIVPAEMAYGVPNTKYKSNYDTQTNVMSEMGLYPSMMYSQKKGGKAITSFVPEEVDAKLMACMKMFEEKNIEQRSSYGKITSLCFPILRIFYY